MIKRYNKELGDKFKFLREAKGISQAQVSKSIGLTSPQAISNLENGISGPSKKMLNYYINNNIISKAQLINILVETYRENLERGL